MTTTQNVMTHTNAVHASRTDKVRGILVPRCMSRTAVSRLHYTIPVEAAVTCKRCLAETARMEGTKRAYAALPIKSVEAQRDDLLVLLAEVAQVEGLPADLADRVRAVLPTAASLGITR